MNATLNMITETRGAVTQDGAEIASVVVDADNQCVVYTHYQSCEDRTFPTLDAVVEWLAAW